MNTLQALALDYAIACYPLLLSVVSYVLIELHAHNFRLLVHLRRPFRRVFIQKQGDITTSVVKVSATFLLSKQVSECVPGFRTPTEVHNINGSVWLVGIFLLHDTSIAHSGKQSLQLASSTGLSFSLGGRHGTGDEAISTICCLAFAAFINL